MRHINSDTSWFSADAAAPSHLHSELKWTDIRIEELKRLLASGISGAQIATALGGVSRSAVLGKIFRLGLKGPNTNAGRPVVNKRELSWTGLPKRRSPTRKPPSDIADLIPEIVCNPVTLIDLQPHNCRWPVLDGLYCGATIVCRSYCAKHYAMGYEGPRVRGWQRPDTSARNRRRHLTAKAALSLIDTPSSGDLPVVAGGEEAA